MKSIKDVHEFLKYNSCENLMKYYYDKCINSKNNTYITVNDNMKYDNQLKNKKLFGVSVSIKDNICVKNMKTTCASQMLENFIPNYNATVVKNLIDEGAIIVGKANMDQFGVGSSSTHSHFGPVINPLSKDRPLIAGGSSGGPAAAIAESSSIVSLGTDTGGSVRNPAALCHIVGLKPTYGRCSRYGIVAFGSSLDQVGIMSHNVNDAAIVLDVISSYDVNDPSSYSLPYEKNTQSFCNSDISEGKIGIIKEFMNAKYLSETAKNEINNAIEFFKSKNCTVHEFSLPEIIEYGAECYHILSSTELASNLARFDGIKYGYKGKGNSLEEILVSSRSSFGEEVKRRIVIGNDIMKQKNFLDIYNRAKSISLCIKNKINNIFSAVDTILTPVVLEEKYYLDDIPDSIRLYEQDGFTSFVNLTKTCAISVPVGKLSVQLVCDEFCEDKLIAFASALESSNE